MLVTICRSQSIRGGVARMCAIKQWVQNVLIVVCFDNCVSVKTGWWCSIITFIAIVAFASGSQWGQ